MHYKRNEPFRFTFEKPAAGLLKKSLEHNSVTAPIELLNISNHGAKIKCKNNINLKKGNQIILSYQIENHSFDVIGNISWTRYYSDTIEAGLFLDTDEAYQQQMIAILKAMAKKKQNQDNH